MAGSWKHWKHNKVKGYGNACRKVCWTVELCIMWCWLAAHLCKQNINILYLPVYNMHIRDMICFSLCITSLSGHRQEMIKAWCHSWCLKRKQWAQWTKLKPMKKWNTSFREHKHISTHAPFNVQLDYLLLPTLPNYPSGKSWVSKGGPQLHAQRNASGLSKRTISPKDIMED